MLSPPCQRCFVFHVYIYCSATCKRCLLCQPFAAASRREGRLLRIHATGDTKTSLSVACRFKIKQDRSSPVPTVYSGINRFMYGQVVTCPRPLPSAGSGFPLVSPAEISLQSLTRCWIYFFCYLMMLFSKNLISIARLNFFQLLKLFLACTDYLFHSLRTSQKFPLSVSLRPLLSIHGAAALGHPCPSHIAESLYQKSSPTVGDVGLLSHYAKCGLS